MLNGIRSNQLTNSLIFFGGKKLELNRSKAFRYLQSLEIPNLLSINGTEYLNAFLESFFPKNEGPSSGFEVKKVGFRRRFRHR